MDRRDGRGRARRSSDIPSVFLDTNVLVYFFDLDEPDKRDVARSLLRKPSPLDLVISTQVLLEFYSVVTRKLRDRMTDEDAAAAVERLSALPVVATDAALVRAGISISRRVHVSVWDGMIVAAATAAGCDRLLTEDLSHGQVVGSVTVENPFAST